MGMQSFRGAGGGGAYFTSLEPNTVDAFGEYERMQFAQDVLTDRERRVERVLVGVATVLWIGIGALVVVWLV